MWVGEFKCVGLNLNAGNLAQPTNSSPRMMKPVETSGIKGGGGAKVGLISDPLKEV